MRVIKSISITLFLSFICLLENYLNTFISYDFGIYIFFLSLVFIGVDVFNQKMVLPIFFVGIFYDAFFSTYYLGLYSAIFIAVLMISNFFTSKYGKVNVIYLIVITVSLLIYKLPIIIQFDASYWLASLLISIIINFFLFVLFKRVSK